MLYGVDIGNYFGGYYGETRSLDYSSYKEDKASEEKFAFTFEAHLVLEPIVPLSR